MIHDREIDLRQSILSIINFQSIKYENIVFIVFPSFGDKYAHYFKQFVYLTDTMIVTGGEKLNIFLKYLAKINYKKDIFIKSQCEQELYSTGINIKNFQKSLLNDRNYVRNNIDFESKIDNILLNNLKYYKKENEKLTNYSLMLKKALFLEDNYNEIKKFKGKIDSNIRKNEELIKKLELFRDEILKIVNNITTLIDIECQGMLDEMSELVLFERCENLIDVGYYEKVNKIINEFFYNSIKGNILKLKLNKAKNMKLDGFSLYNIYNTNSEEQCILKAKIEFRKELKLSEFEILEIIKNIEYLSTAEEFFLKGCSLEKKIYVRV